VPRSPLMPSPSLLLARAQAGGAGAWGALLPWRVPRDGPGAAGGPAQGRGGGLPGGSQGGAGDWTPSDAAGVVCSSHVPCRPAGAWSRAVTTPEVGVLTPLQLCTDALFLAEVSWMLLQAAALQGWMQRWEGVAGWQGHARTLPLASSAGLCGSTHVLRCGSWPVADSTPPCHPAVRVSPGHPPPPVSRLISPGGMGAR
jgi:hypothetical protein